MPHLGGSLRLVSYSQFLRTSLVACAKRAQIMRKKPKNPKLSVRLQTSEIAVQLDDAQTLSKKKRLP